jgi:hypothetical protein
VDMSNEAYLSNETYHHVNPRQLLCTAMHAFSIPYCWLSNETCSVM